MVVTETEVQQLRSRVNELEESLKFLYRQLDIDYADPNSDPRVFVSNQDALRRGNKIDAIKLHRELTGAGLPKQKVRSSGQSNLSGDTMPVTACIFVCYRTRISETIYPEEERPCQRPSES